MIEFGGIFENLMDKDLHDLNKDSVEGKTDIILKRIEEKGFNTNEMGAIIRNKAPFQMVDSVAGSGKTTTLNFKLLSDIYSGRAWGKKIWVNTFLKSGAEALKQDFLRKVNLLGISVPLNNIQFSTIHSEFYKVLTSIGIKINIIDPALQREMRNNISKELGFGRYPGFLNNQELQVFDTLESYLNSCIKDPDNDKLIELGIDDLSVTPEVFKTAVANLYRRRLAAGVYSYDDLQSIMYDYTVKNPNPALINIISNRFNFIYIDECQDISRIQYEILKVYFKNTTQAMFVGDTDQSIYSWRGADVNILTHDIKQDFNADTKYLSINYRVPANILNPIAKSIKNNKNRIDKPIVAAKKGGEIDLKVFSNRSKMNSYLFQDLLDNQMNPNYKTIAVLASLNIDITGLAVNMLIGDHSAYPDFSIGGTINDITRKSYKQFWDMSRIFTHAPNNGIKDNLKFMGSGEVRNYQAQQMEEWLRNQHHSILDLSPDDLFHMSRSKVMYGWRKEVGDARGIDGLMITFDYYREYYNYMIETFPQQKSKFDDYITKIDLMQEIIDSTGSIVDGESFLQEMKNLNERLHDHYNKPGCNIILTTPFDFKGKEADLVYTYDDTMYKFPRAKATNMEEERRLHYINGTRAKKKHVYLTIEGLYSPYLSEMGLLEGHSDKRIDEDVDDDLPLGVYSDSLSEEGVSLKALYNYKPESDNTDESNESDKDESNELEDNDESDNSESSEEPEIDQDVLVDLDDDNTKNDDDEVSFDWN